jgi:hypothetical protein
MGYVLNLLALFTNFAHRLAHLALFSFFIALIQPYEGGCNFWKWENIYEDYLFSIGQIVLDQSEASSSINKMQERMKKGANITSVYKANSEIDRHLMEIVWLLKVVICCLGILVLVMVVCVCRK